MKILIFRTNIASQEMIEKLAALLNKEKLISKWDININIPEKMLSISGEEITPDLITKTLESTGFKIELLRIFAIGGHDL